MKGPNGERSVWSVPRVVRRAIVSPQRVESRRTPPPECYVRAYGAVENGAWCRRAV